MKNNGEGRPRGRLQKHAPASLQLNNHNHNPYANATASFAAVIPILSPVILHQMPLPETDVKAVESGERGAGVNHEQLPLVVPRAQGWQHPALNAFTFGTSVVAGTIALRSHPVLAPIPSPGALDTRE
ncbi:hypothetical protein Dimus_009172 [Dionaea muscipula]